MKTIKEHLETLPEPYRTEALSNLKSYAADIPVENIKQALLGSFAWDETPEGHDYWAQICENPTNPAGLAKREHFAGLAMVGLMSGFYAHRLIDPHFIGSDSEIELQVSRAIKWADELLKQLKA